MIDNDKIDKAFDKVDSVFVQTLNEYDLTFEEIAVIFWRLQQKIREQEMRAYTLFFKMSDDVKDLVKIKSKDDDTNHDIYR